MKHLIVVLVLVAASCAMPTEPTSTSTAALGAGWYDVYRECRSVCAVIDAEGCALTREPWWWSSCLSGCVRLADEAYAAGCLDQAEDWQRCEWVEQERGCWGVFPYQTSDNCSAESDAYMACRSDA